MALSTEVRSARLSALRYHRANDSVAAARRSALIYANRPRTGVAVQRAAHRCAKSSMLFVAKAAEAKIDGDVLTFPVVAFVEGVRQPANSYGPELFLASEFEPALPSAIGMPVLFNHPQITDPYDGWVWYPSISDPGPFDPGTGIFLGQVEDGRFDTDGRMILDVSVSLARISMAGDDARAAGRALMDDGQLEVSLGHWSNVLPVGGFWPGPGGEPYFGVHSNIEFDHLALLEIGQEGACSIKDGGCGAPRA